MIAALRARLWYAAALMYRFYGLRSGERLAFQRSEDAFCRALDLVPTYHQARYQRGLLYWRELRLPQSAVEDFTRVLVEANHYTDALFMRAMAYEQLGNYLAAAEDLEMYLQLDPHSKWGDNAARQLHNLRAILEEMTPSLTSGEAQQC